MVRHEAIGEGLQLVLDGILQHELQIALPIAIFEIIYRPVDCLFE